MSGEKSLAEVFWRKDVYKRQVLEDPNVVAVGGAVRPCNGAEIENGRVVRYRMPRKLLPCMQAVSYTHLKEQRLVAVSNWPTTDPFTYPEAVSDHFMKCAQIDVEHIQATDAFLSGQFASYHVYSYYPDYLQYLSTVEEEVAEEEASGQTEDVYKRQRTQPLPCWK